MTLASRPRTQRIQCWFSRGEQREGYFCQALASGAAAGYLTIAGTIPAMHGNTITYTGGAGKILSVTQAAYAHYVSDIPESVESAYVTVHSFMTLSAVCASGYTGKERGGLSRMRWAFWSSRLPMMHVDK
jgi:hypothetical protein